MVSKLSFEGRVAVVTGAGRGIGRAYAQLLADRGASVVVNDLGGSKQGKGADPGPASAVASAISDAGGKAIADNSDISTTGGAETLVRAAVDQFGRIDVLVNNAGIVRWATMPNVDADNVSANLAVHTLGSFHTARAAWPHMVEQEYGRIVMTTSTGMLGLRGNLAYATAKGGVVGLARTLATEGAKHNIKVNLIAPAAFTRMASQNDEDLPDGEEMPEMSPDLVAPMVAFLAHEDCPVTGEIYSAGSGRFARLFIASTEGYVHSGSTPPTVEDVSEHWDQINDESGYDVPADLNAWSAAFLKHLG